MAHGDGALAPRHEEDLGAGAVELPAGRVSVARMYTPGRRTLPFRTSQLASLDEALTLACRTTGLHFSIYLGDLGEDIRVRAEELHAAIGSRAPGAVLVAVSPGQRVVEVVTGSESSRRIADRGCELAVKSMVASFKDGDLTGGLTVGLRLLADEAGPTR
ncbi:MAG: DUF5130 domain-containing protein [Actinomycetota bacterium]|nr:DUF5130 domain-containing protein [Actinomycetota bacterium]